LQKADAREDTVAKKRSTIENRVYLFKDLAAAFLADNGAALLSGDSGVRSRALRALGDLAYASCVVADTQKLDAEAVGKLVARGIADAEAATPVELGDEVGEHPSAVSNRPVSKRRSATASKSKASNTKSQKKARAKARAPGPRARPKARRAAKRVATG
jgi:hypothetical protein